MRVRKFRGRDGSDQEIEIVTMKIAVDRLTIASAIIESFCRGEPEKIAVESRRLLDICCRYKNMIDSQGDALSDQPIRSSVAGVALSVGFVNRGSLDPVGVHCQDKNSDREGDI